MNEKENRRQHFRVDLLKEVPGTAEILSVNDRCVNLEKSIPASLIDLSAGGMRVRIPYNLPTQIVVLNVKFEFEKEPYNVCARILRKTPIRESFEYGLKFTTARDQASMIRYLNMYRIKNSRFRKVEWDLKARKYIGCFVKMLELIDKPAYIITENRLVVASNIMAQEKNMKLGERCYKLLCNEDKICQHCKLEKVMAEDYVIEENAIVQGVNCTARWLKTEDGLIIHYYK